MKPHLSNLTAFLLILACVATTCKPECPDCPEPDPEPEVYPKEIAYTKYILNETLCHWIDLPYDDKIMIINSSEELEKHISCTEGSYPLIDFSKNSLLVASGKTLSGIYELNTKKLLQFSPDKYELNIEATLFDNSNLSRWNHALVVEKLNDKNFIDLNVMLAPFLYEPCNCIMDTLIGEWIWSYEYFGVLFKSIIRFLGQNEDASINYEVFVEDTLYSSGSFKDKQDQKNRLFDIKLPHGLVWYDNQWIYGDNWYIYFQDWLSEKPSDKILLFQDKNFFYKKYFYQKIE